MLTAMTVHLSVTVDDHFATAVAAAAGGDMAAYTVRALRTQLGRDAIAVLAASDALDDDAWGDDWLDTMEADREPDAYRGAA